MRKAYAGLVSASLFSAALVASSSAGAITFPSLTTIYIGSGVRDTGGSAASGIATVFHCSNVSGLTASVRFLVLAENGAPRASFTTSMGHGTAVSVSTHNTNAHLELQSLVTGSVSPGVINIESTQSGVFCTAVLVDDDEPGATGVPLHLIRIASRYGGVARAALAQPRQKNEAARARWLAAPLFQHRD